MCDIWQLYVDVIFEVRTSQSPKVVVSEKLKKYNIEWSWDYLEKKLNFLAFVTDILISCLSELWRELYSSETEQKLMGRWDKLHFSRSKLDLYWADCLSQQFLKFNWNVLHFISRLYSLLILWKSCYHQPVPSLELWQNDYSQFRVVRLMIWN